MSALYDEIAKLEKYGVFFLSLISIEASNENNNFKHLSSVWIKQIVYHKWLSTLLRAVSISPALGELENFATPSKWLRKNLGPIIL